MATETLADVPVWFLAWIPFAIGQGNNPFFTDYTNDPFRVNVLVGRSTPLLGLAIARSR